MNTGQSERRKRRHDSRISGRFELFVPEIKLTLFSDDGSKEDESNFEHLSSSRISVLSGSSSAEEITVTVPSKRDDDPDVANRLANHSVHQSSEGSYHEAAITRKSTVFESENGINPGGDSSHEPADLSPPRRRQTVRRRHDSEESDLSPPRKAPIDSHAYAAVPPPPRSRTPSVERRSRRRGSEESDLSPPRKGRIDAQAYSSVPPASSRSPSTHSRSSRRSESRPSKDKHSKTAREKSSSSKSGRDAKPVVRKKMTVKKETEEEKALREELEKRFAVWSKGYVKQVKEREAKLEEMAKEIEKPLARYAGDEDLEAHLKSQLYEDDPMYEYMMRKRRRENPGPPQCSKARLALPNRFSIPPGARWDGVDRSNGFETRLLSQKNLRQAEKEEYYKWAAGTYE
ncbi:Bud13 domain containing protein [Trichuris trichiura]|uniref:BUD13 homolog n=1 Tax=Trichuris trichiura TaxID=36087 RepID=A0A077ZHV4_TRITR|nr:Bud13 domain containing protein [Trichuris trichiura]